MLTNDLGSLRLVTRERSERYAGEARAESLVNQGRSARSTPGARRRRSVFARIAIGARRRFA
jgi:hypothetical protein